MRSEVSVPTNTEDRAAETSRILMSSNAWQVLALDTLGRLTRQFALQPDCNKLIDLVLLSLTGQLSTVGAFACFLSSLGDGTSSEYRGSGLLHKQIELAGLLEYNDCQRFFTEQEMPLRVEDLEDELSAPPIIGALTRNANVAALVPMTIGDSLLGVLGVARKANGSPYDQNDLKLLATLSDTISPLLHNSLLYASLDSLNQWHRDVMDSVQQGVAVFSPSLRVKQINTKAQQVLQSLGKDSASSDAAVHCTVLFDDETFPGWAAFIAQTVANESEPATETLVSRDIGGDRFFVISVSRTSRDVETAPDVIVTFDEVTEQRETEHRMFEMELFAEKGMMAASIAHELNNYLALILGGIELTQIASSRGDNEKVLSSLEKLRSNSKAMEKFTAGLTDYQKAGTEKGITDLNTIVRDVTGFARLQKRFNGVSLGTILSDAAPKIEANADQISQLLMNLLNNAADAIKDGDVLAGTVTVATDCSDGVVWLSVSDNGAGIPANLKDKLFQTRFTTKDYGHGFGMVTCGRILKNHSAESVVESEQGHGTTIRISFSGRR